MDNSSSQYRSSVPPEDSAVVMYSGGLDSTVAAVQMAQRFRRVVLLTADLPYTINVPFSKKNLSKMRAAFPACEIEHRIIDGREIRKKIWENFCNDYFRYCRGRGIAITCLGCKMAMMVMAIRICLQDGIGHLSNGITRTQIAHPHSTPQMVNRFGEFIAKYNIVFINDVYDIPTRHQEKAILDDYGLGQGVVIGASSVSHQPRCFIGPPTKLWLEAAPINRKDMLDYFDSKVSIMQEILSPDFYRREALRGRLDLRTRADETYQGEHTYEFSPLVDRSLGVLCYPIWWMAKGAMQLMRKRNKGWKDPGQRKE